MGLTGLALIAVALLLWFSPPTHKQFAPAATGKAGIASVDSPSETLSGVLLGIGAVLLLVAANGRKLASIKIGDTELAWATDAAAMARRKARTAGLSLEQQAAAASLALTDAYERARQSAGLVDTEAIASEAVEAVARSPLRTRADLFETYRRRAGVPEPGTSAPASQE